MRTSVLIPLHASARWTDVVSRNLVALAPVARIVVSDATGVDDTLDHLRSRHRDLPVAWLGPRPLEPGWVAHCNDLLGRAGTEFAMWLPHDDDLRADWVTAAESALDADPGSVLAVGPLAAHRDDDEPEPRYSLNPGLSSPDTLARIEMALRSMLLGSSSDLGMAFRGVQRVERTVPLPSYGVGGDWCDILWALELLTRGAFVPTDATYVKRWYDGNTHGSWRQRRLEDDLRRQAIPFALRHLDEPTRLHALTTAWSEEALLLREDNTRLRSTEVALRRKLRRQRRAARRRAATSSASPSA